MNVPCGPRDASGPEHSAGSGSNVGAVRQAAPGLRRGPGARRALLVVTSGGARGGAEVVAAGLLRHLDPGLWRPVVATLEDGAAAAELRGAGFDVRPFPRARLRHPASWMAVATALTRIARREGVQAVYANHNAGLVVATAVGKALRLPVAWHVHDPLGGPTSAERAVARVLRLAHPDLVIAANPAVAASLHEALRLSGQMRVVLPGLDRDALAGGDRLRGRSRLGARPDAVVVVCLARFVPGKGQLDLLHALAGLELPRELVVVLCGPSHPDHGAYEAELTRVVEDGGLGDVVRLLGYVSDAERADLLAAADLLVHPARTENFGLAVAEAMALGLPVVAADAPGPKSLVDDPRTGLLCPAGDVAALRSCLERALADPAWRHQAGAAGRRAVASLSWERMAGHIEAALLEVLLRDPLAARPRQEE